MTDRLITYSVYIPVSVAITIWVAQTLFAHGKRFLVDVFSDEELASSVNHLLVMGFYLFNFGYVALQMTLSTTPTSVSGILEALSLKIGLVLVVLAVLHVGNVIVLTKWRSRTLNLATWGPPPATIPAYEAAYPGSYPVNYPAGPQAPQPPHGPS